MGIADIVLKVDPARLANRDLDIRYVLPDVLAEESGGTVKDGGYAYASDKRCLLLFLKVEDVEQGLSYVLEVVRNRVVLENKLGDAVTVARNVGGVYVVAYPQNYEGEFSL